MKVSGPLHFHGGSQVRHLGESHEASIKSLSVKISYPFSPSLKPQDLIRCVVVRNRNRNR